MSDVLKEIYSQIPERRKRKLQSSPACWMSEPRFIHFLLLSVSAKDNPRPCHTLGLFGYKSVLYKPELFNGWVGSPTGLVLKSSEKSWEGMIVDKCGNPLRMMRSDATYPSRRRYSAAVEDEGVEAACLAQKLKIRSFELDEPIMD